MKLFQFQWPLLLYFLTNAIQHVAAGGERAVVERIFAYYAYLAEEILGASTVPTIAVGCVGTFKGGPRCNFNEFLAFIQKDGMPADAPPIDVLRPKPWPNGPVTNFEDMNVKTLKAYLDDWPAHGVSLKVSKQMKGSLPKGVFGLFRENFDLLKIAGVSDFETALAKIGEPLGKLRALHETSPTPRIRALLANSKVASQVVSDFRSKDLESYRVTKGGLQAHLDPTRKVFVVQVRDSRNTLQMSRHKVFDYSGTIARYPDTDIRTKLDTAIEQWKANSEGNQAETHLRALEAAQLAEQTCACADAPIPL